MTVYYDGGTLYFPDGTSMSSNGTVSRSSSGYLKRWDGLMFQWGSTGPGPISSYSQPQTVYFPTTFPRSCFLVIVCNNWNQGGITSSAYSWNQSYFTINFTYYASWMAIGY